MRILETDEVFFPWGVVLLVLVPWLPSRGDDEASKFLDLLESLQPELHDFQCEFEGSFRFVNSQESGVGGQLPDRTFSGTFVWRRSGDTRADIFHEFRDPPHITVTNLVVLPSRSRAEIYERLEDSPIGTTVIHDPRDVNADRADSLGQLFLVDTIKRLAKGLKLEVSDGELDGKQLKVLSFSFQSNSQLYQRFWLDLNRGGHAVRRETYNSSRRLTSRSDIELSRVPRRGSEIWMPVSASIEGHASIKDGKPYAPDEVTGWARIYVVNGTLEINKSPRDEIFRIEYKPGTPVSDNLRKHRFEFGAQKIASRPTKAEAEQMLNEAVAKAEEQKKELVAVPNEGIDWTAVLTWGFGAAVLVSLVALWIQRRR